MSRQINK